MLSDEALQHFGQLFIRHRLGTSVLHRKVRAVPHVLAAADDHDVHGDHAASLHQCQHVYIAVSNVGDELLADQPVEPRDLVANARGLLERQLAGCGLHLRV